MERYKDMDAGFTRLSAGLLRGERLRLIMLGLISGALMGAPASAALFISFGDHTLLPDTTGQKIAINVSNDGEDVVLGGFQLLLQVADGGPARGGSILGPRIEAVDLLNDTPFESDNLGGQHPIAENSPQFQVWNVGSANGVTLEGGPNQLMATVTFDTTGLGAGTWDLHVAISSVLTTRLLDFDGDPLTVNLQGGTLTVVPEPSTTVTIAGCLLLGGLFARQVRRKFRREGGESPQGATH